MGTQAGKFYTANSCGHQHDTPTAAVHCATNMLRRHPKQKQVEVIRHKLSRLSDSAPKTSVLKTITRDDLT